MADLDLSVVVSRDWLNLAPLDLNDGVRYQISNEAFLGGQVAYTRTKVTSAWMDGELTVNRTRTNVQESISVEVYGRATATGFATAGQLRSNLAELIAAMAQDSFTITVIVDGSVYIYSAEAADYQVKWDGPRMMATRSFVTLAVPRSPVPVSGGV